MLSKCVRAMVILTVTALVVAAPVSAKPQKPVLHAKHWVAITGKPLGASAGARIFYEGGNAVDAACAMLAATSTMWDVLSWGGETQALIYNPQFGTIKVAIRPPFSKVIELSSAQLRQLISSTSDSRPGGSDEEERLLEVIRRHFEETGQPVNVTQAMEAIGIASGRKKQQLVDGLEQRGLIRSEKLKQRGGPRVLFPIPDGS